MPGSCMRTTEDLFWMQFYEKGGHRITEYGSALNFVMDCSSGHVRSLAMDTYASWGINHLSNFINDFHATNLQKACRMRLCWLHWVIGNNWNWCCNTSKWNKINYAFCTYCSMHFVIHEMPHNSIIILLCTINEVYLEQISLNHY